MCVGKVILVAIVFLLSVSCSGRELFGYVAYCPCMGRFGNQADHFLGALGFAHGLNRTLILPPWVEYRKGEVRSTQVPFDAYFDVTSLRRYHDVLTMEEFMAEKASSIWPPEKRISFCYTERKSLNGNTEIGCNAKDGNPFGPFWDTYHINFVQSEMFGPLHYDVHNGDMVDRWHARYPASEWPVIAFTGAPASFPVQEENRGLHQYLKWSQKIATQAQEFIKRSLGPKGSFIGIHLRNGIDWIRACDHIKESPNLFASAQCLGYRNEKGILTMDMCMPSRDVIVAQLKRTIKKHKEQYRDNPIGSIFVASDNNHMLLELRGALQRMDVAVIKLPENNPHVDLAILGMANHFIGNCVSSYSAFVKRERDVRGFPSTFWAFPQKKIGQNELKGRTNHEEL